MTLKWGLHRPPHGVAYVKASVANDKTRFKVLTLKHQSECGKVNIQLIGENYNKIQGAERNKNGKQVPRTDAKGL
jgi:hypothetical protein